jgi:hypothetical protein
VVRRAWEMNAVEGLLDAYAGCPESNMQMKFLPSKVVRRYEYSSKLSHD